MEGAPAPGTEERMEWSDPLVEALLFLRMHKYAPAFRGSKSKSQLAAAWIHIVEDFNKENKRSCVVLQLKNKFNALKTTYNSIKGSEPQTGNNTERPIEYPSIWPTLVMYFGDLTGMGNRDYGQTGSSSEAPSSGSAQQERVVVTEGATTKRNARKRKMDLAGAVALMAESLSTRLNAPNSTGGEGLQPIMTKMARMEKQIAEQQQTLEAMQASIDQSRQVNSAILTFLRSSGATASSTSPPSAAKIDEQTSNP